MEFNTNESIEKRLVKCEGKVRVVWLTGENDGENAETNVKCSLEWNMDTCNAQHKARFDNRGGAMTKLRVVPVLNQQCQLIDQFWHTCTGIRSVDEKYDQQ